MMVIREDTKIMYVFSEVTSIITRYYLTGMITAPSIDNRLTGSYRRGSEINDWVIRVLFTLNRFFYR